MKASSPRLLTCVIKNEDWLSVIVAAILILLSVTGVLGTGGIHITF